MREFEPHLSEKEIELDDIFRFLSTYLTVILIASLLGAILGILAVRQVPRYTAISKIRMHPESQGLFGDLKAISALSGKKSTNDAESSVPLLGSFQFRKEFTSAFLENKTHQATVANSGINKKFNRFLKEKIGIQNPSPAQTQELYIEFFAEQLGDIAKFEVENGNFIVIKTSTPTAEFGLQLANNLALHATNYLKESRRTETEQVRAYLKRKISEVENERDQILTNLQTLQTESEYFGGSLHESGFFGIGLDEKKHELYQTQLNIKENISKISSIKKKRPNGHLSLSEQSIVDSLLSENQYLQARVEALQSFLKQNNQQKGPLATTLSSYHLLQKEFDLLSNIFTVLTTNQVQVDLDYLSLSDKISVFDYARPQNVELLIPDSFAFIGGFVLFFSLAVFFCLINILVVPPVTNSRDLVELGIQHLGSIPKIKGKHHKLLSGGIKYGFPNLNSSSKEQMAFNNICRKVLNVFRANKYKVAAVSSPHSGDGKSTLAFNLALCVANMGHKVLLVDGDKVNPTTSRRFGLANKPGLKQLSIASQDHLKSIHRAQLTGVGSQSLCLDVLPAGQEPTDTKTTLSSTSQFQKILLSIANNYDYIFIDTPPVLSSIDGNSFFELADVVLLQASYFTTKKQELLQVLHSLPVNKEPHIYSILNFVPRYHNESYTGYSYRTKSPRTTLANKIKLAHSSSSKERRKVG